MTQVIAGERGALRRFEERMACVPRLLSARNRRAGGLLQHEELEDVVQDTLVAVWRKLARYDGRVPLETWVWGFCVLEYRKGLRRRGRGPGSVSYEALPEGVVPLEEAVEDRDLAPLWRAMERLDPINARILLLRHFEELSFEHIGHALDLAPKTARNRYYLAIVRLRELLSASDLL